MTSRVSTHWSGRQHNMRIWQYKIYLVRHLGIPIKELGQVPAFNFLAMVREVDYQRRLEQYPLLTALGQVVCVLVNDKTHKHKPAEFVGDAPKREARRKMSKKETYDVILGDGQTYTLSILNANMMEAVEDEYDKSWAELFKNARVKVIKSMLLQMLKPKYPDMTMDKIGMLVTTRVLPTLVSIITDMSK